MAVMVSTIFIASLLLFQFHLAQAGDPNGTTTPPVVPAVFVFGDSIVDTGNNNVLDTVAKSNFPPYGRDLPNHAPTGRFSNGKISVDFIASKLGIKEFMPAYLGTILEPEDLVTGVTFASGGTGYDTITAAAASVISMPGQLELFEQYKNTLRGILGDNEAARHLSQSLFIVCAGSNDVVEYFLNPMQWLGYGMNSYADHLVQIASSFLQDLVAHGAAKVGVVGIPPVGCMPSQRFLAGGLFSSNCADDRNQLAQICNEKLRREIERLNSMTRVKKMIYIDAYTVLFNLIQNHSKYGFKVSELGCCGTGRMETAELCNAMTPTCADASEYIFWDSYHPTERAYEIMVQQLFQECIVHLM